MAEKTKAPFWKPALIYGAIVGFVGILLSVIFYVMNLYAASWTQWVSMVVGIAILAYCLVAYRNEHLGGFASYGQLFKMALVIGVVASIIGVIFSTVIVPLLVAAAVSSTCTVGDATCIFDVTGNELGHFIFAFSMSLFYMKLNSLSF